MDRKEAINALAQLKIKHRELRKASGEADAAGKKGAFYDLKDEMDAVRKQEAEILSHFENAMLAGGLTIHATMNNEANIVADALTA